MAKRNSFKSRKNRKSSNPPVLEMDLDPQLKLDVMSIDRDQWHSQTLHIYDRIDRLSWIQEQMRPEDRSPENEEWNDLETECQRHFWYLGFDMKNEDHYFFYRVLRGKHMKMELGPTKATAKPHLVSLEPLSREVLLRSLCHLYDLYEGDNTKMTSPITQWAHLIATGFLRKSMFN